MKTKYWIILMTTAGLLIAGGASFGDNDDEHEANNSRKAKAGVAPVQNQIYTEECGACHFPYQAGFLPERSWRKLMANLNDHFGDNAEMSVEKQQQILAYLTANSADKSDFKRSRRIMSSLSESETPLRITDTSYFKAWHREVPNRLVKENDQVRSFSNCNACHQTAKTGSYSEGNIKIPGHGRWDD